MRTPTSFMVAALLLGAGLVTGCAEGSPGVGATPAASPPAFRSSGPLADPESPRRVVYDERLVSDPLPAARARTARSSMPADEAVAAASKVGVDPALQPGRPSATLRLVYPGRPDGAQKVAGKPAWVLTWRGSAPAVRGPKTMTDEERRALEASLECVYIVTVDPATRTPTTSVQFCERRST